MENPDPPSWFQDNSPDVNPTGGTGSALGNRITVPQAGQPGYNPVWLPGGVRNPDYAGPGGTPSDVGGLATLDPKSITSQYADPIAFAKQYSAGLLGQGVTPQQFIDWTNKAYGLQSGSSLAWRSIPEAPGGGVIELPGGSYLAPGPDGKWGYNQGDSGGGGSASGQDGPFSYPDWTGKFDFPSFQAPTGLTEQNDPGFQSRLQLGTDALQRSAAAKGTLLTGGTLQDLNAFAQNYASNEYQNVYGRAANDYNTNRSNALQNYMQNYQQYLQGYQQAAQKFGINYGVAEQASNDLFNRQLSLAQLGFAAAGNAANAGSGIPGYLANAGNIAGAGSIAQGNIYGNTINNLGNTGLSLYQLSQFGGYPPIPGYGLRPQ